MTTVEIHPAYLWTCDHCAEENVTRLPSRCLDPGSPDDYDHLCSLIEGDLHEIYSRVGSGDINPISGRDRRILRSVLRAGRGEPDSRYSERFVPTMVECKKCHMNYLTVAGKKVADDLKSDEDMLRDFEKDLGRDEDEE